MVGIRFGGARDEILTLMQRLGVITPPYFQKMYGFWGVGQLEVRFGRVLP